MIKKQIFWCYILSLLICLSYGEARCRFYSRRLNNSADSERCKVQCTKGTCLGWVYNNETTNCMGWVIDAVFREEHNSIEDEDSTKYDSQQNTQTVDEPHAEGSIVEKEKEEDGNRINVKEEHHEISDTHDRRLEQTYDGSESSDVLDEEDADNDIDQMQRAAYYADFYNTNVPDEDDDDTDYDTTDYFSSYSDTNEPRARAEDDDEEDTTGYDYFYSYNINDSDFCDIIASPLITTPMKSYSHPASGCSFRRIPLGYYRAEKECMAACQKLISNVYGGCLAWVWNSRFEECEGLLLLPSSHVHSCGVP
eukprot:g465.t1